MGLLSRYKHIRLWFKSRHFGRSAVDERYALAVAVAIGTLSGIAAITLKVGIGWLGGFRLHAVALAGSFPVLPLSGLVTGYLTGWILEKFCPEAAGGGIPQVKAALANFPVALSWRVAVVKMIGAISILGGGQILGRRAPTVHIGAALAAQLSNWLPTTPDHRRQMIAAGAAAGLAAGFTTPIAGVLFVVEELARDVSSLTLETAIVASFTGAIVSMMFQNTPSILSSGVKISFSAAEIPVYFLLGVLAGSLGALFNGGVLFFHKIQRRWQLSLAWRIGSVGLVSGTVIAFLPPFFRDNSGLREFLLDGVLNWSDNALAFGVYFLLTMLAYSSGAPGGLLAPALVMGSALGFLVGEVVQGSLGLGTEATYALAGMGAFFTGVVRAPVTAIVIVFELHRNFNIVLPLMLSCAVALIVAESLFKGSLYEHLLRVSGIRFNEETSGNDILAHLTAADVMQSRVETLAGDLSLDEALKIMSRSHHRGFPVMENDRLTGIFTQSDLDKLPHRSGETLLKEIMTPNPISVDPAAPLTDVLFLLNRYKLSRLPVTEGQKLVGIITRTDIIRVEADRLTGVCQLPSRSGPSYVVYQTRAPATGTRRLLLPIANPRNASSLLKIALAIARQENYEIECLQVILVPHSSSPSEVSVDTREERKLLHRLERAARGQKVPLHTRVVVARSVDGAILETIRERHIKLLVMGWKGYASAGGTIFGEVVDTLIHHAPCEILLVKLGDGSTYPDDLDRDVTWVIPTTGGPNTLRSLELLPALAGLYPGERSPELWFCQVYSPEEMVPDLSSLEAVTGSIEGVIDKPIVPLQVRATSVPEAVIHLARSEHCSLVLLGASGESLLDRFLHGNIPSTIARSVDCTVLLYRGELTG